MRELFEQEYRKHEKSLFLVAVAYLHNTEDAKDVLQDAALSAYKAIDGLKNKKYFKTWIKSFDQMSYRYKANFSYEDFIKMTPLTSSLTQNQIDELVKSGINSITIDLKVVVGREKDN